MRRPALVAIGAVAIGALAIGTAIYAGRYRAEQARVEELTLEQAAKRDFCVITKKWATWFEEPPNIYRYRRCP
jgi:hypothetical protein